MGTISQSRRQTYGWTIPNISGKVVIKSLDPRVKTHNPSGEEEETCAQLPPQRATTEFSRNPFPPPAMASSSTSTSSRQPHIDYHNPWVTYFITTFESEIGKFKELTHDEIVEGIQDSSGETLWTIRRPIRGWYLVLRSPLDVNPQNFVGLQPKNVTKGKKKKVEFTFRLKSLSSCETAPNKPVVNGHVRKDSGDSSIKRRNPSTSSSPKSPNRIESTCSQQPPGPPIESLICLQPIEEDLEDQTFFKSFTNIFTNNHQKFQCIDPTIQMLNSNIHVSNHNSSILLDYEDQNLAFGIHSHGVLKIGLKSSLNFKLVEGDNDIKQHEFHCAFWVAICIAYLGFRADQEVRTFCSGYISITFD
ncbi:hypothetical protein VP01_201g5 [Puccinia sorghi]|uniref:Uncharacterized protein n=1 Tax=Puccinia sorghi TaxID=27349 RepID=A0A0L6VB27_9BASI|nr:hypothetical protein VP01_201g5 [Puccinia sorghi]